MRTVGGNFQRAYNTQPFQGLLPLEKYSAGFGLDRIHSAYRCIPSQTETVSNLGKSSSSCPQLDSGNPCRIALDMRTGFEIVQNPYFVTFFEQPVCDMRSDPISQAPQSPVPSLRSPFTSISQHILGNCSCRALVSRCFYFVAYRSWLFCKSKFRR